MGLGLGSDSLFSRCIAILLVFVWVLFGSDGLHCSR